jgi:NAD+ kinase
LNDAVLNREALARISTFAIALDGRTVAEFRADGVIVSTPTGSTAYNLSAGGPIVYPDMNAIIATAICPHTLAYRPVVLPTDPPVTMEFNPHHGRDAALLQIDGQECLPILEGDIVSISAEPLAMQVVIDPLEPYFARLRRKLSWSGDMQQSSSAGF